MKSRFILGITALSILANTVSIPCSLALDPPTPSEPHTNIVVPKQAEHALLPSETPQSTQQLPLPPHEEPSAQAAQQDEQLTPQAEISKPADPSQDPPKNLVVPADTVIHIALNQALHSKQNQLGQSVSATVAQPVYLGPFLAIPKGSTLNGQITRINPKPNKDGHNPYIVVEFNALKRPSDPDVVPFHGSLIAYKTGLRKQDYVWKLPSKNQRKRANLQSVMGGALSGIFINPIFGPLVGAGAALLKTSAVNSFARGGDVRLRENQVIPISVGKAFMLPVSAPTALEHPASLPDSGKTNHTPQTEEQNTIH